MGRRKLATRNKLIKAIKNSNGIITIIAERLGVTRQTVSSALKNDPIAKEYYDNECDTVLDIAEVVILDAIKNQDVRTAQWYLERKGASRGYNPALKIDESSKIQVVHEYVDDLEEDGKNDGAKQG